MRLPAVILGFVVSGAAAQSFEPPALVPVDPGGADVGPLSTSLRDVSAGLRVPTGFTRVYRAPGADDRFMRVDGGLYAVFPRSHYANTGFGPLATIPDGTIFHIGPPWRHDVLPALPAFALFGDHRAGHASGDRTPTAGEPGTTTDALRVNSIQATAEAVLRSPGPDRPEVAAHGADPNRPPIGRLAGPAAPPPPIVADATYRAERIRALMRRAVAADG